jgi:hypothetical protein
MCIDKYEFAAKILDYWYLVEFLDQTDFPTENKEDRDINKKAAEEKKTRRKQITMHHSFFPEKSSPAAAFANDSQVYSLYSEMSDEICICMGKVRRGKCDEYLKLKFGLEDDSVEKDYSRICLIGLKCDPQSCYIEKSLSISSLVWGIARLDRHKGKISNEVLSKLLSLKAYNDDMLSMEEQLMYSDADGKRRGKILSSELLRQLFLSVTNKYRLPFFGSDDSVTSESVMIYKRYQSEEYKAKDSEPLYYSDLSKSFYTNDLEMIRASGILRRPCSGQEDIAQEAFIDYIVGVYAEAHEEIGWIGFSNRVDIWKDWGESNKGSREDFFNRYFEVALAPMGKWPSRYMPAFMQQLAINFGMRPEEVGKPIFSVNGPPGTGKTTLLKEIIAGNLVERAKLLVQYNNPDDAFEEKQFQDGDKSKCGYSEFHKVYYELKNSEIKKYGMLVVSCNNAAVENITKELPDGTALCKGLLADEKDDPAVRSGLDEVRNLFDIREAVNRESQKGWDEERGQSVFKPYPDIYFTKYANDIVSKQEDEWDRWGLISAPFGKSGNIMNYARKVLHPYIYDFGANDKINGRKEQYAEAVRQFKNQLAIVEGIRLRIGALSQARRDFWEEKAKLEQQCSQLLKKIDKNRLRINQLQTDIAELERRQQELAAARQETTQMTASLHAQKECQADFVQKAERELQAIRQEIMDFEAKRGIKDWFFGLIGKVSMLSKTINERYAEFSQKEEIYNNHNSQLQQVLTQIQAHEKRCNELSIKADSIRQKCQKAIDEINSFEKQIGQTQGAIAKGRNAIENAEKNYQGILRTARETKEILRQMTVLDETFWQMYDSKSDQENTEAQVLNPWFTVEYNREREKLFYLALQVHKNFIMASKSCLFNIKNLLLMWRVIEDDEHKLVTFSLQDRENCFSALLNTVFLLTPVLSTTFASVGSMLSDIKKREEIGLLIVDEAGQAQPQMALGALYRCQRAIVVGDPKQVEPVVTAEMDAIKRIIRNDENQLYQSKRHSVQEFADRLNPVGTHYTEQSGDHETWVGCPLVVHRRCISPMYEISNAISYDNTMKQQTRQPKPEIEANFCLESSRWINVCGTENNSKAKDHYVKAQGEAAMELILRAFSKTKEMPSLYVISPFTTVRTGLKNELKNSLACRNDKRVQDWVETHIGTVHTFQGREADEVIFLLGCDKNAVPAVRWVNTNIVNVAVTRARYRLYIIGDYTVWQSSDVMQQVKRIMDSYAIRVLYEVARKPESAVDKNQVETLLKQIPSGESFQVDDEINDVMVSAFQKAISDIWIDQNNLTEAELTRFGLSPVHLQSMEPKIKQGVIWGIKLYSLFALLKDRYQLDQMDYSCSGVMLCKAMEMQLKDCLLPSFQRLFPNQNASRTSLSQMKPERATVGTFTWILREENNREHLAQKQAKYNDELCDKTWWYTYYMDLSTFKNLRNACCHSGKFKWSEMEKLIDNLFIADREFLKTLVGKHL